MSAMVTWWVDCWLSHPAVVWLDGLNRRIDDWLERRFPDDL